MGENVSPDIGLVSIGNHQTLQSTKRKSAEKANFDGNQQCSEISLPSGILPLEASKPSFRLYDANNSSNLDGYKKVTNEKYGQKKKLSPRISPESQIMKTPP